MPILPREPDLYPDSLFEAEVSEIPWGVAHVRSRQEKVLARYLRQRAIPYFLPQLSEKGPRRLATSYAPLFPGYVFFRCERTRFGTVWRSDVVANLIEVEDQRLLEAELRQIYDLLSAGATFRREVVIDIGDPVRINGGPFQGYFGIVMREKGSERLLVQLTLLHTIVAVEFEKLVLSPANKGRR